MNIDKKWISIRLIEDYFIHCTMTTYREYFHKKFDKFNKSRRDFKIVCLKN